MTRPVVQIAERHKSLCVRVTVTTLSFCWCTPVNKTHYTVTGLKTYARHAHLLYSGCRYLYFVTNSRRTVACVFVIGTPSVPTLTRALHTARGIRGMFKVSLVTTAPGHLVLFTEQHRSDVTASEVGDHVKKKKATFLLRC